MKAIFDRLYQFSTYIPPLDFTVHHYLLAAEPAILFASGTAAKAQETLGEIKGILKGRELKYIFVSHLESDECGGISVLRREYPEVQVISSALGARELPGYGYAGKVLTAAGGTGLKDGELDLCFYDYPAEVHLQNGLVCFEKNSGIFYSSDLMLRYGNGAGQVLPARWQEEVAAIDLERVPSKERLRKLKANLSTAEPSFVAVGHGVCLNCEE